MPTHLLRVVRAMLAMLILGTVMGVTGCGGSPSTPVRTATPPPVASASQPSLPGYGSPEIVRVVAALRLGHPDLTQGRSDRSIASDVRNTCLDVRTGVTEPVVITHVAARLTRDDAPLPTARATQIYRLIRSIACP